MEVRVILANLKVELGLELCGGRDGLERRVTSPSVQKPGLLLAGYREMFKPGRIQVLGRTEIEYLWSLTPADRERALQGLFSLTPPAVVVTRGLAIPEQAVHLAEATRVPLLVTSLRSSILVDSLHKYLANRLAKVRAIHGVLVDVFGVGVLLVGKSGIGKSECALELVMRGHRLVADDVVDVNKKPPATIIGSGNELIRHHMEIRGLGIINIKDLFGVAAIRETKRIDLVVALEDWEAGKDYERFGVRQASHEILAVQIPKVVIPVRPGRSLTSIVEVAARNQLLKVMGHHSAQEFQARIERTMSRGRPAGDERGLPWALSRKVTEEEVE